VTLLALILAASAAPDARQILDRMLDQDPWGLSDAETQTRFVMKDKRGSVSELLFLSRARRYDAQLAKVLLRFSKPADLAGSGVLVTQKRDADDERFLFLPELKRSRRISGSLRASSFMGSDFSYADIDRKDLREGKAAVAGEETIGKYPCWHVVVTTTRTDSDYSRVELWIRKDNDLPILWSWFDRAGEKLKTLTAEEVRRVGGRWFITRSVMQNLREQHQTEWILEQVTPRTDIPEDEFTLRNLEKMG
jgi:hypothetical protein